MNVLKLSWVHYKRMIKTSSNWLMMFLIPVVIILFVLFMQDHEKAIDATEAAFNIEDEGMYWEELLKDIGIYNHIFINDQEGAIQLLENKEVNVVYHIPSDFTDRIKKGEMPTIETFVTQEDAGAIITEVLIQEWLNTKIYEEILIHEGLIAHSEDLPQLQIKAVPVIENNYINIKLRVTMLLIIFYIIYASVEVCEQMVKLKNDNVLLRAATTSNSWKKITGSIYIALFLIEISIFSLVFITAKFIGNFQVEAFLYMMLTIILAVCISIALGFLMLRLVKKTELISVLSIMVTIVMFYISVMGSGNDANQAFWLIHNIAKFMPIYWLLDIVNHLRLFPAVPILILMSVAMFTVGNIRGSRKELIEK
ncbi:ABC-2 type transport system permease protein [Natranaerovirga hydrolytica]|uniref:ABC-2 type transport system permease protein n=1 Tax=Natranaerovirga hydrolytica TaxID=680378 RepID=A0A4R1M3S0_9FIRM|nr:ABC transporter permease [Natranaerovirga hydrolytica]TCK86746.1 ABC-2 type transport system permease protein [Natranaerovirga hydrolytica]